MKFINSQKRSFDCSFDFPLGIFVISNLFRFAHNELNEKNGIKKIPNGKQQ